MRELYGSTKLTSGMLRIIELVSKGYNNAVIGKMIGNTENRTKNILREVYDRTGFSNRTELALWWVKQEYDKKIKN